MANEFENEILKLKGRSEKNNWFSVGFKEIDVFLRNIEQGNLIAIGGRPKMGKTSLIISFINNLLEQNKKIAVFTLEIGKSQFIQRLVSQKSHIHFNTNDNSTRIDIFENPTSWNKISKAVDFYEKKKIVINDKSNLTVEELENNIKTFAPNIVFIDCFQLLKTSESLSSYKKMNYIAKELKRIASENNVIIFLTSKLSRKLENRVNKYPTVSDIKDCTALEEFLDVIMMIYREKYYDLESQNNNAEISIVKNDIGDTGSCTLEFDDGVFTDKKPFVSIKNEFVKEFEKNVFYAGENFYRCIKDGKYGFVSASKKIITPYKYDDTLKFVDEICAVKINDKWGFIDKNGKEITKVIYDYDEDRTGKINKKLKFQKQKGKNV